MRRRLTLGAGLALAGAALLAGTAPAGEAGARKVAKGLVEKHKDAIVLVQVVIKIKAFYNGREVADREQKLEINGTVIKPNGLTVVSNAGADPTSQIPKRPGLKIDTSVTGVKIILADGTEHPAKIVQTDKDLDLAFVRPDDTELKLPCLELKKAPAPELLDDLVSLTRLGRKANREPGVAVTRVLSIIKKPRVRYIASGSVFAGCPVFNAAGQVLGLALRRTGLGATLAVLPCGDILEVVAQVPPPKKAGEETPPAGEKKPAEETPPAGEKKPAEEKNPFKNPFEEKKGGAKKGVL